MRRRQLLLLHLWRRHRAGRVAQLVSNSWGIDLLAEATMVRRKVHVAVHHGIEITVWCHPWRCCDTIIHQLFGLFKGNLLRQPMPSEHRRRVLCRS